MEQVSLIITAYDGHDLTVCHVKHSMDVTRVPDEIIVINDGGTPDLLEKLQSIERKCPIVYSRITEDITWNYNGACNLAVWLSKGDFLMFEDKDNIPSRTFYEEALQKMAESPDLARVQATKRRTVSLDDILHKPRDEWTVIGQEGPNMGTAMIRRQVYLDAKGHDERFCGRYGWMYYDWRTRVMNMVGNDNYSVSVGEYFYTKDGQSNLSHENDSTNLSYRRDNCRSVSKGIYQPPEGILNFRYETIHLPCNTQ